MICTMLRLNKDAQFLEPLPLIVGTARVFYLDLSSGGEGGPLGYFRTVEAGLEEDGNLQRYVKTYVKHLLQGQEGGQKS